MRQFGSAPVGRLERGQETGHPIPTAALAGPKPSPPGGEQINARRILPHRRLALTLVGTLIAAAILALVLAGRQAQFAAALLAAPIWVLTIAALLHLTSLVTRSEAWNGCVLAAGGTVPRRLVFRAAGIGSLASVVSAQVGVATRIAALRRSAPKSCPRVPAMMAAEVPIVAVEAMLAALFMFTLVGPLSLPWWIAVLRDLRGHGRLVALVVTGVVAHIARNWLILHAVGVDASVLDAIAVLIVTVSLSPLPIGPSVGAAAAVLILGAHRVGATA